MYDRTLKPIPQRPSTGMRYRIESLIGITGAKMAKYRASWYEVIMSPFNIVWRPHLLSILVFEVLSLFQICNLEILIVTTGNAFRFRYWD
jgi:hypothetical protein